MGDRHVLKAIIEWWHTIHKHSLDRGLDYLMNIIKAVYERTLTTMENTAFLACFKRYSGTLPDKDGFGKVGEAVADKIKASMEAPGITGVGGTIKKIELNVENLEKCCALRRAYLFDDAGLGVVMQRGCLSLEHYQSQYEIFLDGFVCAKHQQKMRVCEVVTAFSQEIKGCVNWVGRAAQIAVKTKFGNEELVEKLFGGHRHLVYFEDGMLQWVCKNIVLGNWKTHISSKVLTLTNPCFLVGSVIDKRPTYIVGKERGLWGTTL